MTTSRDDALAVLEPGLDSMCARLLSLEERVADLESRMRRSESPPKVSSAGVGTTLVCAAFITGAFFFSMACALDGRPGLFVRTDAQPRVRGWTAI